MSDFVAQLAKACKLEGYETPLKWTLIIGVPTALYLLFSSSKTHPDRSIESFYKQPVLAPQRDIRRTGGPIDAFIKKRDLNGTSHSLITATQDTGRSKEASNDQIPIVVVYGTEFGFSKEIAEKMCSKLTASSLYWPILINMADYPKGYNLSSAQVLLVVCSTQGDGVPPSEARDFCEWLWTHKAESLSNVHYSVCALGDKSYTHFCRCGRQLDETLQVASGACILPRAEVNREDWVAVNAWMAGVLAALSGLTLKTLGEIGGNLPEAPAPVSKSWGKNRPYPGTVSAVRSLTIAQSPSDKVTAMVEITISEELKYEPGDALGVLPANHPQVVEDLLWALEITGEESISKPSWHYGSESELTAREALALCYDLKTPRSTELLELLKGALGKAAELEVSKGSDTTNCEVTGVLAQLQRLALLASDPSALETYLAARHVADILRDFPSASVSMKELLPALRQLQPRLYSISSSPLERPKHVQITVAQVNYESLGITRYGVASTQLTERTTAGTPLPVYVARNPDFRLPADPSKPIIMIGPGTGLAPFRAFIMQRILERAESGANAACGQMVLFFGCRRRDQDYLYGEDLEKWATEGVITLFTAFSREQAHKVYVQDRIKEAADLLWRLLDQEGAHLYVCGDASSMAGAVHTVLTQIIAERLPGSPPDPTIAAAKYLDHLSNSHRYERDVWY